MIYGLYNKDTGHVRYVGRTIQKLYRRLNSHRCDARDKTRRTTSAGKWIRKIGCDNVDIVLLERSPKNESKAEVWWMEYLEFLGCELVNDARFEMKICTSSGIDVTDEMKSMMGEVSDKVIAKKFDVSRNTILKHRSRLGINGRNLKIELSKECVEQLGEKPDSELADEFEVSKSTVRRRREEKGIDPYKERNVNVPEECLNQLGEKADGKLAEEYGLTIEIIKKRRVEKNIDPSCDLSKVKVPVEQLGTKPDNVLAEKYNVSSRTICERRKEHGIEAFKRQNRLSDEKVGEVKWLAKNSDMTYQEIGNQYGISDANVSNIKNEKRRADVNCVKPSWFGNKR
jgi:DNA-binding CsgD family transcriptional regulator